MARIVVVADPSIEEQVLPKVRAWESGFNQGLHQVWTKESIPPGKLWRQEIKAALRTAEIVVVFINSDLLADNGFSKEWWPEIQQKKQVLLVLYGACMTFAFDRLSFRKLFFDRALNARSSRQKDQAWIEILGCVQSMAEEIDTEWERAATGAGSRNGNPSTTTDVVVYQEESMGNPKGGPSLADQARQNVEVHQEQRQDELAAVGTVDYVADIANRKRSIWAQIDSESRSGVRRFEVYQLTDSDVADWMRRQVRTAELMEHLRRYYDIGRGKAGFDVRTLLNSVSFQRRAYDLVEWLTGPECGLRVELAFRTRTKGYAYLQGYLVACL